MTAHVVASTEETLTREERRTMMSGVFRIDPLSDPRWLSLLERHSEASIFHTPEWLRCLHRTYGYEPVLYTSSPPGRPLSDGVVFCRIDSWLTGSRLVSLPFSDHCQPLAGPCGAPAVLLKAEDVGYKGCKYVEIRPLDFRGFEEPVLPRFQANEEYYFHSLDLRPDLDVLFRSFHKSCIQRKIQRAERESLTYEAGRSESILAKFYHLQLLTRRRHRLPPQPLAWFRNLIDCLRDKLTIRILSKGGQPIAGILTLSFKTTLVYKYGCSDAGCHRLGGMPLLFWRAIQEGKQLGAEEFDLGRSEIDNRGLAAFKEHLGATRSKLAYFRLAPRESNGAPRKRQLRIVRYALARVPGPVAQLVGSALYRHIG